MRDFASDVLRADRPERVLPVTGEFCWSASSHKLFRYCPRAWFYFYYLAQGGWEIHSREESCHAYLLKYLDTASGFLGRTLQESLKEALLSVLPVQEPSLRAEELTEAFQREVTARYFRALEDVEENRYLRDPKYTSFMELHYRSGPDQTVRSFFHTLLEHFNVFFRDFERLSLAESLAVPDPLQWHNRSGEYISFDYGSGRVILGPALYFFTGKEFHAWKITAGENRPELEDLSPGREKPEEDFSSFLSERTLSAFCKVRYGESVPCVCHLLHLTGEKLLYRTLHVKPLPEEFIEESRNHILKVLHLPGGVRKENFPCCGEPLRCRNCRFRALCDTVKV